jgi:hypothetical protein
MMMPIDHDPDDPPPVDTPTDIYWYGMNRAAEHMFWLLRFLGFI